MNWTDQIKAEVSGMAGGESYYDLEDIYQAIKERLLQELRSDCNQAWCDERHQKIETILQEKDSKMRDIHEDQIDIHKRLDGIHGVVFKILLVGFGNLFGVAMLCLTLWLKAEGVL